MAVCTATIFSSALATDGRLTIPAPTRATVQGLSFIFVFVRSFGLVWLEPDTFCALCQLARKPAFAQPVPSFRFVCKLLLSNHLRGSRARFRFQFSALFCANCLNSATDRGLHSAALS